MQKRIASILLTVCAFLSPAFGQDEEAAKKPKAQAAKPEVVAPKPDIADGKYGQYDANTFDLWKPKSKKPTALVVFIHGGGLSSGDKSKNSANQINKMLEAGLAVMAINYRLTGEAVFPQHYMDCARAVQYARFHAREFNIDPARVGATGASAGGMISLWLGFHDDLADKGNADPVLRESTRLKVMAVSSAQTTLVPETVTKYVGALATQYNSYYNGKLFGLPKTEMDSPKARQLLKEISPLTYLTKDDAPVWAIYSVPNKPLAADATTSDAIHHPGFGAVLKEEMDRLKIECKLRHKDDGKNVTDDMVAFLTKYLK